MFLAILNKAMNQTFKLIFRSDTRLLFKPQSQGMCKKKIYDKIGPADPMSNLHHIKYAVQENETASEMELRKQREDLQEWNEVFWTKHNLKFIEKKKEFQENELKKKDATNKKLSADDMSIFYKDFLDKNWKTHLTYLLEWVYSEEKPSAFMNINAVGNIFKELGFPEKEFSENKTP